MGPPGTSLQRQASARSVEPARSSFQRYPTLGQPGSPYRLPLKKTLEHFDIINKDLISIFTKNDIKPIDSLNKKLDPNLHQAMMEIEDDQKEPGTIVQEVQKGFMIKDRLLRPSLVGVSKKAENKDDKSEDNKENLDK